MPCPFPGMDPYIENQGSWPDFQSRFITHWCEAISALLPDHYEARIDERVQLVGPDEKPTLKLPDVSVIGRARSSSAPRDASNIATLEPVAVPLPELFLDEVIQRYIRILKRPERTLITVLELLSPANKVEPGWSDYFGKRNMFMRRNVHMVELDLLLRGQRLSMGGPLPPAQYYALVSRIDGRSTSDVYAWTVRQPLPTLPIPLQAPDPDIWFDLAAIFATTYERGRYARSIRTDEPLTLPLDDDDRAWVIDRAAARTA